MKLIPLHLIRTFVPPFFFGLSITTFLLMIDVLERYINLFLEKGIRFGVATEVLFLSLGHTFALSIPMAVLVGTLMSIGHLAADNEITALKANGVSLYRVSLPLIMVGALIMAAMMAYNNYVLPESNHRLRNLLLDIHRLRPALEIKPNTFAEISDEYTIFVRHKDDKKGDLEDVILFQREQSGDPSPDVIVAKRGHLETIAPGRIQLDLFNGEYHSMPDPRDPLTYNRTEFQRQQFIFDLGAEGGPSRISDTRGEREMNVTMLERSVREEESEMDAGFGDAREILGKVVLPAYAEATDQPPAVANTRSALDEYRAVLSRLERTVRSLDLNHTMIESHRLKANKYLVELHKKFSIPVACVIFTLLGVPLAVVTARGGKGVSMGMSLATFLVYYLFLTGGEKLSDRGFIAPWLAMWAANIVLGVAGIVLLYQSVQETKILRIPLPRIRLRKPVS
jgi:lipopolysaccharide export system permease protein